jgi:hypothetical protein
VAAFFPREEEEEEEANAEDLDRITPLFSERNADADDDAMRKTLIIVYTRRDRRQRKRVFEALSGKNVSKNVTKIPLKRTRQRALTRRQKRDHEHLSVSACVCACVCVYIYIRK